MARRVYAEVRWRIDAYYLVKIRMDFYRTWCELKPGVSDLEFSDRAAASLDYLKSAGLIEGWQLTPRKLGLGPAEIGEFILRSSCRT